MTGELEDYILGHIDPEPEALARLDRESNLRLPHGHMTSGHLQGRLLKMLVRMVHPERVLELGTFSGYSSLCMAEAMELGAELHSIELSDELEPFIRRGWERAAPKPGMTLHIGDALQVMREMESGRFQLIFIDADKRRYPDYYPEAMRLCADGGFIIADNTLWSGHVAESGRHDAQTDGLRRFNDMVAADSSVEKVILPVRDGLTLIYKKIYKKPNSPAGVNQ